MRLWLAALLLLGCRKPTTEAVPDTAPPPVVAPLATPTDPFQAPPPIEIPPGVEPQPFVETITSTSAAPSVEAPKDPFVPVIAAVQQAAVGCFSPLPPGNYAATVEVVVTAAGTATRVNVTSGPEDPAIRKCLEQTAQRAYPSSASGRKLSIDVIVKG